MVSFIFFVIFIIARIIIKETHCNRFISVGVKNENV
jgi:hypothetical protein